MVNFSLRRVGDFASSMIEKWKEICVKFVTWKVKGGMEEVQASLNGEWWEPLNLETLSWIPGSEITDSLILLIFDDFSNG